jgi:mono/diheme cytochrome c family protein
MAKHFGALAALVLAAGALTGGAMAPAVAQTYRERGAYLVDAIAGCGNCHTPKDKSGQPLAGAYLSGGYGFDEPFGHAVASNITPDPETGIGKWTIDQIAFALRNGKRPDGTTIGPPMPFPFYQNLSDRDARAMAVYLKEQVKPVRHEVARSQFKFELPAAYWPPVGHIEAPDPADKIAYGRYLAGPVAHCMECHTPRQGPKLDTEHLGAGGREFADSSNPGARTVSRNITPDPESGIGRWSDADVKRAILVGKRPDGTPLSRTMPSEFYAKMSSDDVNAIVAYLRTLPPVK